MNATSHPAWADEKTLRVVRPEVRSILEASPAFQRLPDSETRSLAGTMVKVASYMANPDGLAAQELSEEGGLLRKEGTDREALPAPARCATASIVTAWMPPSPSSAIAACRMLASSTASRGRPGDGRVEGSVIEGRKAKQAIYETE